MSERTLGSNSPITTIAVSELESLMRMKRALEFLVEVKEHKDKNGKDLWYRDAQPIAWDDAKSALGK